MEEDHFFRSMPEPVYRRGLKCKKCGSTYGTLKKAEDDVNLCPWCWCHKPDGVTSKKDTSSASLEYAKAPLRKVVKREVERGRVILERLECGHNVGRGKKKHHKTDLRRCLQCLEEQRDQELFVDET